MIEEDGGLVEGAVSLGVFEDEDAILGFAGAVGVVGVLEDPEAAAVVEGVGDGLDDVGFASDELCPEAFGQNELCGGLSGGKCGGFCDGSAGVLLSEG